MVVFTGVQICLSQPTLTVPSRKSTKITLNINLDFIAPQGGGVNRQFKKFPYWLQLAQTLVKRQAEISLSPGISWSLKGRTGDRWGAPEWRSKNWRQRWLLWRSRWRMPLAKEGSKGEERKGRPGKGVMRGRHQAEVLRKFKQWQKVDIIVRTEHKRTERSMSHHNQNSEKRRRLLCPC